MIKLISWKVAVVGFGLPWLGFAFGCLFSKLCRRERKDIIAIAIETGIQNTGKTTCYGTGFLFLRIRTINNGGGFSNLPSIQIKCVFIWYKYEQINGHFITPFH